MSGIQEIFDKNPLDLTHEDIEAIVAQLRKARLEYKLGDKTAGKAAKKPKAEVKELDLAELDL